MPLLSYIRFHLIFCIVWITTSGSYLYAQNLSKNDLEQQKKKLEEEVRLTNDLLRQTRLSRKQSHSELQIMNSQITTREQIVHNLNLQVKNIDNEILYMQSLIQGMQKDIQKLKEEYLEFAYITYKSHSNISILLWLFSAESFTQAYNRLKYFRDFSAYRQKQIQLIRDAQVRLAEKLQQLEQKKQNKNVVLQAKSSEYEQLMNAKKEKQKIADALRKQENYYREQLNIKMQNMRRIQASIEALVLEEQKQKQSQTTEQQEQDLTAPLSKLFEKNKGKLPWPVSMNRGVITGRFGVQEDEVSGGKISNNGIYITTSANETVRAVFGGKVTAVQTLPMLGKVVIIQHGNYRTVYANLAEVYVKTGQEVEALAPLGTLKAPSDTEQPQLHFLIYEGKNPLNPEQWIMRK